MEMNADCQTAEYGGHSIYGGGDDTFTTAPVASLLIFGVEHFLAN